MKSRRILCLLAICTATISTSCTDDPKMVAKREEQKIEIARLHGEIALLDEKLKNLPPDVTDELAAARKEAEKQSAEIAGLEAEIASLNAKKRSLLADYDAYRAKYTFK